MKNLPLVAALAAALMLSACATAQVAVDTAVDRYCSLPPAARQLVRNRLTEGQAVIICAEDAAR